MEPTVFSAHAAEIFLPLLPSRGLLPDKLASESDDECVRCPPPPLPFPKRRWLPMWHENEYQHEERESGWPWRAAPGCERCYCGVLEIRSFGDTRHSAILVDCTFCLRRDYGFYVPFEYTTEREVYRELELTKRANAHAKANTRFWRVRQRRVREARAGVQKIL